MHPMLAEALQTLCNGLDRKALVKASDWAVKYRVMGGERPGPWNFRHFPWAKQIHDTPAERVCVMKGAQLGITEVAINLALKWIDIDCANVLYLLPTEGGANKFSAARIEPALESSEHLKKIFANTKNIGHKRAGMANLFIRGTRSKEGLKSDPISLLVEDELDEMEQDNLPLAEERMSGHSHRKLFQISTPTVADYGIAAAYKNSTQNQYIFKCPFCSRQTLLTYPECLCITAEDTEDPKILESFIMCRECKHKLDHQTKHEWLGLENAGWVPTFKDRLTDGYGLNQLYSTKEPPYSIAKSALKARLDPISEQEFYNSKLGLTHKISGAQVDDEAIAKCVKQYRQTRPNEVKAADPNYFCTMGIDIGIQKHFEIDQWFIDRNAPEADLNLKATCRMIRCGTVRSFDELHYLIVQYFPKFVVVDAQPERTMSAELVKKFYGIARCCFYAGGCTGRQIVVRPAEDGSISVDRTSWMDLAIMRFMNGKMQIPFDTPLDYKAHIKAPIKHYGRDRDGNPVARYITGESTPDHYAHARTYSEIAFRMATSRGHSQNLAGVI